MKIIFLFILLVLIILAGWYIFKSNKKIIKRICIVILSLILLVIMSWHGFWYYFEYQLNYTRTHVENIDTSFFTNEMKNDIINNAQDIPKKYQNKYRIEISSEQIIYFDLTQNILSIDNIFGSDIQNIIQKYNIAYLNIHVDNTYLEEIDVSFKDKKYLYIYKGGKHTYLEGYVIPVVSGRVEKVIDEYWYIWRVCDRNICQEPQG